MTVKAKTVLVLGGCSGAAAIGFGAFGAHALKAVLSPRLMAAYNTAAEYHLLHSVVLLVLAGLMHLPGVLHPRWAGNAAVALVFGLLLFCGSLYSLALSGITALGMITPIGGLALISAWLLIAVAVWCADRSPSNNQERL